jgi:hypothetical protein
VVSLNVFTTVQGTEHGAEGFNRVTQISSTHFRICSCRSKLIFVFVALYMHLSVLYPLGRTLLNARYLTREIDANGYSIYLAPMYQITRRRIANDSPSSYLYISDIMMYYKDRDNERCIK